MNDHQSHSKTKHTQTHTHTTLVGDGDGDDCLLHLSGLRVKITSLLHSHHRWVRRQVDKMKEMKKKTAYHIFVRVVCRVYM